MVKIVLVRRGAREVVEHYFRTNRIHKMLYELEDIYSAQMVGERPKGLACWLDAATFYADKVEYRLPDISQTLLASVTEVCVHEDPTTPGNGLFLTRAEAIACVPIPGPTEHKGSGGRPLLAVGSERYHGAAVLAALACARAGADYTYVATHPVRASAVSQASPDLITIAFYSANQLQAIQFTTVLVGSGLDRTEDAGQLFHAAVGAAMERSVPCVVDADGLHFFAQAVRESPEAFACKPFVLTPNHREFNKLHTVVLGVEPHGYNEAFAHTAVADETITVDLQPAIECVRRLSGHLGCCILVKNLVDICCYHGEARVTRAYGAPRRCSGQGDVLAGCLVALARDPAKLLDQCILAAECVRMCAREAYARCGFGMVAADLINYIPTTLTRITGCRPPQYHMSWE